MSSPHDFHRPAPGAFSPHDHPVRRRSPSPRRPAYDSYVPHGGALYRDEYPNVYRPNMWRPESYYSRSPSPGRYDRSRPDSRHWEPGTRRQSSSYYPDRRSPPGSPRDKPRRDTMAERMFEFSDPWKSSHVDRSARYEPSDTTSDRCGDRRAYLPRDPAPHRPAPRTEFPHFTGDCYRPGSQGSREAYPFRPADTYRPNYDDELRRLSYSTDSLGSSSHRGRWLDCDSSSIASTPPRQHPRSPTPHRQYAQPPPADGSKKRTSNGPPYSPRRSTSKPYMTPPPDSHHQSPGAPSLHQQSSQLPEAQLSYNAQLVHSQRSPTSGEPPRKKFKPQSSPSPFRAPSQEPFTVSTAKQVPPTDHTPLQLNRTTGVVPRIAGEVAQTPETLRSGVDDQSIPQGALIDPSTSQSVDHETVHVTSGLSTNLELHSSLVAPADHSKPSQASLGNGAHRVDGSPAGVNPLTNVSQEPLVNSNTSGTAEPSAASERPPQLSLVPPNVDDGDQLTSSSTATPSPVFHPPRKDVRSVADSKVGSGVATVSPQIVVSDHSEKPVALLPNPGSTYHQQAEEPTSIREHLRVVVLARLRCDRQTRDERVYPLLRANQVVSELQSAPGSSDDQRPFFGEIMDAARLRERNIKHRKLRSAVVDLFAQRQSRISTKAAQLKEEYVALHERWMEHCARLDDEHKSGSSDEVAVPSGGRATRRSTAILGDAVRSDLEMEQIIASLGVEELTDPSYLAIRNVAKIPDMISVTQGSVQYLFDDTNNILDDPAEFYGASSRSDYWTEEERNIFMKEFAAHPKQFGVIAERLPNKTAAQCVTYYYLHKRQGIDFRKAVLQYGAGRRRRNGKGAKQRGNALLADIRRHDDEVSRVSSGGAPNGTTSGKRRRTTGEPRRLTSRRAAAQPDATPASSATTPDPEAEHPRRRRRPASSGRLLTNLVVDGVDNDTTEKEIESRPAKRGRKSRVAASETIPTPSEEVLTAVVEPSPSEDQEELTAQRLPFTPNTWLEDDKSANHYFNAR